MCLNERMSIGAAYLCSWMISKIYEKYVQYELYL